MEFENIYALQVVQIPPNRPLANRNPIDEFHAQIIQAYEQIPAKLIESRQICS